MTPDDQFLTDADAFGAVVAAGGDWAGASPCDGWTAVDVLAHVVASERDFLTGRLGLDLGPQPTGDPADVWVTHRDALRATVTPELWATPYEGYFGPTTVGAVLDDFYGFDLLVHRWDLGRALGREVTLSDAELARIEAKIPEPGTPMYDAFYSDGICRAPLPAAEGATREAAVLARLGRAVEWSLSGSE